MVVWWCGGAFDEAPLDMKDFSFLVVRMYVVHTVAEDYVEAIKSVDFKNLRGWQ